MLYDPGSLALARSALFARGHVARPEPRGRARQLCCVVAKAPGLAAAFAHGLAVGLYALLTVAGLAAVVASSSLLFAVSGADRRRATCSISRMAPCAAAAERSTTEWQSRFGARGQRMLPRATVS